MQSSELFKLFQKPGVEWRGKPFWSWNGELDKDELIHQSHILGEMGFGGYFMHSRSGLITEYLGEDWFKVINSTADAGESEGLEVWLYDEDRWPSGSAGGKVTEDPQYRMKSLVMFEMDPEKFAWDSEIIFAFAAVIASDRLTMWDYRQFTREDDISAVLASLSGEGDRKILAFRIVPESPSSNYNGNTYIDTMSRAAVDKFIEMTHEAYQTHCGDRMGRSIKGIFSDEPHRGSTMDRLVDRNGVRCSPFSYTDDIFEEFQTRYGYDVRPLLPEVYYRYRGEKVCKARIDYIDLCCNLFNERFAMPINQWCEDHGILFTGHVLHEDALTNQTSPNGSLMRFYMNMGAPGIDNLTEWNNTYWAAKQLTSVARQFDKKWLLSELYGCTGWEFPLRSHKIVGDWQALFGINLRCPHLSWYTMEGESKRDYPASISYQSAYWKDYNFVESYFARFGVMMNQGSPVCELLVLNPVESVWGLAHIDWAEWINPKEPDVQYLEKLYTSTFLKLAENRVDFDYGEEQIMAQHYRIEKTADGAVLYIGQAGYRKVLVSGMLTMRSTTYNILKEFLACGGQVIFTGDLPAYLDGMHSDAFADLIAAGAQRVDFDTLGQTMSASDSCPIKTDAAKTVFSQIRRNGDDYIAAFLNVDRKNSAGVCTVTAALPGYQAQLWDMETGIRYIYPAETSADGLKLSFSLDTAASKMMVFVKSPEALPLWNDAAVSETGTLADGEFAYELDEPNVCVLDYTRMKFGDDTEFGQLGEVLQIDNALRDRLGIERRGGEMLQPWFAKQKYTQPYGKLTLEYPFVIDVMPEGQIWLAGERPEVQEYYCNGVRLTNEDPHDWWVDNAFRKMAIPEGALHTGENIITIVTDFKRTTNIEAIYLIGQFGVIAKAGASRIVEMPETLSLTDMAERKLPFYSGRATLVIPESAYAPLIRKDAERVLIKIEHGTGALVSVENAGKNIAVAWEPWTADVTETVRSGADLRITLVNTRRNSFGPLHCVPTIWASYNPGNFVFTGEHFSDEYARIPASIGDVVFLCE